MLGVSAQSPDRTHVGQRHHDINPFPRPRPLTVSSLVLTVSPCLLSCSIRLTHLVPLVTKPAHRTKVSPFSQPSEDVILQSSDGMEFFVNRWILKSASTVFADMFDIPQPSTAGDDRKSQTTADASSPSKYSPPVIPVSEDGDTLERLLLLCHPLAIPPRIPTFDSVKPVLVAAHKYQIDHALELLRPRLQRFSRTQPVRVYAFAARYGMTTLMRDAAREFLMHPDMWSYAPELHEISGAEYHRLLVYRSRCCATLQDLVATPLRTFFTKPDDWVWLTCVLCRKHMCGYKRCVPKCEETAWFRAHWERLGTLLRATPAVDAIRDPMLADEAIKEAITCRTCAEHVLVHMRRFSEIFLKEVEHRLSKVRVSILLIRQTYVVVLALEHC